jgi:hypothetical protein
VTQPLKNWHNDIKSNAASIVDRKSRFKILLKTKNDRWLLEDWIKHHSEICGIGSLIVFDNDSDDQSVLDTYERLVPELLVFKFSGHHNNLHFIDKNPELYRAIAESCEFFIFLDTDEFLQWVDGDGTYNNRFSGHLSEEFEAGGDFVCGIWLPNVSWDATRYWVGGDQKVLEDGVRWGKPLLKASAINGAFINHNIQAHEAGLSAVSCGSLIVQHRHRLYREQRMMSNVNKLRQRHVVVELDDSLESIQKLISETSDPNIVLYLTEIINLRNVDAKEKNHTQGFVRFGPDSNLEFPTAMERERLMSAVMSPETIIHPGLRPTDG